MLYNRPKLMARRHREAGVAGIELLAGLGVAVACGVLWAVVAYYLDSEFVYAALGVGAVVGLTVAAIVKEPNVGHGVSAAGLSVIGLLLGKFLIIQWSISGTLVNEIVNDSEMLNEAVFYKIATAEEGDPEVKAWYLDPDATSEDAGPILSLKLGAGFAAAEQMAGEMSVEEKLVVAEAYTGFISESMTVTEKIKAGLSGWDVAFFGLAMFVAFQIGRGAGKNDEDSGQGGEPETVEVGDAGPEAEDIGTDDPTRTDPV